MCTVKQCRRVLPLSLLFLTLTLPARAQQNLTWDANGAVAGNGGTGTWDSNVINLSWFNGVTFQSWNNLTFDNAIFGATAGAVTLGEPISAHNLTFTITGFTLTGSSLTLGGTTPTVTTNAGVTATIGSVIAGPADLNKAGSGTLTLTGTNTYSGTTTIAAGTLAVGNGGTVGTLGTGTITNNTTLSLNRSDTLTVANAIGGTGTVIQNGNGTTILTGTNTYTGGTTINNGVVQLGDGGTTGSIVGNVNVTANEELHFNRSDAVTFGGVISGAGDVLQIGTGTTILTGTNTYTGGTAITAGTLQIGDGGTAGSIVGNVATTGVLAFNRADAVTFGGVISGTGALTQLGNGTLTLTGTNTYSGGTTISAGTLQIGNGAGAGTLGTGATLNNAALIFDRTGTLTVASAIGGTGTVTKLAAGTTILTGANTYTGTTTISAGILQIGNGATGTLGSGAVVNNAVLNFNRTNALTVASDISGTGAVNQNGTGTTIFTGTNTYTGGTIINNGRLDIGNGGTTGSIVGNVDVTNGEELAFNRSDTITFSGVISGAGGDVLQVGTGTTILTGTNTYTGGTAITAGTLQIGDGGTAGSIVGSVATTGVLAFNRADAVTFGGVISGTGALTQLGNGTLTLTGTNTYSGGTTISAGTLQIGNGAGAGTLGTGATLNNAALIFDRTGTLTVASAIGGTGTVTKLAAGTTILTGANTYTGTTTISAGILQIGNGATGTLGSGAVVNNAALNFNRTNALTVASDISGTGAVNQNGTGTTIFTGTNTYTGGTIINNGRLDIGNGGTTGSIVGNVDVTNGEELAFNRADTITFSGVISGAGGDVLQVGTGTTILTGTNTYTGGTAITAGTLQIGDGGTAGSIVGSVTTSGVLAFNRADAVTFGGVISGTGALTQLGNGTLTLTGTNTYSGGTTISAGTLQIGNGGTTGAVGPGPILNNSALIINRSNNHTVAASIGGIGTVTKLGAGITTLTGANTYTGGTTINAGTLRIGNGGTTGSLVGDIVNDGALSFNRSDTVVFNGVVSGTGALTQIGAGTTTLIAANTYSGGTTISAGTLQIGNGGATGSIVGNVANNGTLAFNRSDAVTFGGVVSGTGTLIQSGTGTTTLTGTNTYTGSTTINNGILQIGDGGTTGTLGTGTVTNNAALVFNRSDVLPIANLISGTGSVAQLGSGTTILTANNTYTGGTTIDAGTLQIGDGGVTGSIVGDVTNNGTLVFDRADAVTFGGLISGSGSLMQVGTGITTLTGANTYAGGTIISGGTLEIGNGGITGMFGSGNVTNNSALRFNRSDVLTVDNVISGTGSVIQFGAGTTILTGTNTYTGGTTINSGILQIGNGGTAGSIVGDVINNSLLAFNRADSLMFGGSISGTGGVQKDGAGTLSLNGASTYSGSTIVNSGTLLVNGSLGATAVSIGNGATLGGIGSIAGDVTVGSGATLSPGMSPGTLTVGSLNLSSGSILDYELSIPSVVGGGVNDLVAVNGNLTLDGRLDVTDIGGFGAGTYTLMTYGGALTNRGLAFGFLPGGFGYELASGGGSVRLMVSAVDGSTLYWDGGGPSADGVTNGGSGIWTAGLGNWTTADGTINTTWQNQRAVFRGASGTVTVQGPVTFSEMQFDTSGYRLIAGSGGVLRTGSSRSIIGVRSGARATISVPIAGSGGLVKRSEGTLVLTGANRYTGGTTVSAGILQGSTRSLAGNIVNDATVVFDQSTTGTYAGRMSGDGRLVKNGTGLLVLTGANTYTGGTLVSSGALQGNSSSLRGDIVNDAAVIFDEQTDGSYAGTMSGTGRLFKIGDGTLIVSGANTYQGGTVVSAGTLKGNTGSLQGDISNDAALIFDQSSNATFRGTLFGAGTLTKSGSGTLMLNGAHAQGATRTEAGTLRLDGTLTGSVDVAGGAAFSANGAIGGALNVRGTANIDRLEAGGDVTFNTGSRYGVTLGPDGGNSFLITSGRASIDGATVALDAYPGISNRVTHYNVLQANAGLSGTAQAVSNVTALEPWLSQTGTTLFITLLRTDLPLQSFATTPNGIEAGGAIDRLRSTASGDLAYVTRELTALDDSALAGALDSVAGEIHASSIQLTALDGYTAGALVRDEVAARAMSSGPLLHSSGTAPSGWGHPHRWWTRLHAQEFTFDRVSSAQSGRGHLRGFLLGLDWSPVEGWLVGAGGGYSTGRLAIESGSEARNFSNPRALSYVGYRTGRWVTHAGLSAARMSYDTTRRIEFAALTPLGDQLLFGGVKRHATGAPSGLSLESWAEQRVELDLRSWSVFPSAGLRFARYGRRSWKESGAGDLSVSGPEQTLRAQEMDLGVLLVRTAGRFQPHASGMYRWGFGNRSTRTTLQFSGVDAGIFAAEGLPLAGGTFVGRAGMVFRTRNINASVSYEMQRASFRRQHLIQVSIGRN